MEQIALELMPHHFVNENYGSCTRCPIANAAKEKFNTQNVNEGVNILHIGNDKSYKHEDYDVYKFENDLEKARNVNFKGNQIIRTIKLYTI